MISDHSTFFILHKSSFCLNDDKNGLLRLKWQKWQFNDEKMKYDVEDLSHNLYKMNIKKT